MPAVTPLLSDGSRSLRAEHDNDYKCQFCVSCKYGSYKIFYVKGKDLPYAKFMVRNMVIFLQFPFQLNTGCYCVRFLEHLDSKRKM